MLVYQRVWCMHVYAMGLEDFFVKTPPFSSGDFATFDDQDGRAGPGPLI